MVKRRKVILGVKLVTKSECTLQWTKNLYENKGYEDNYTDASFLKDLRTNENPKRFTYREAVAGALKFSTYFSCVVIFFIVFHLINTSFSSSGFILSCTTIMAVCGYFMFPVRNTVEDIRTVLTVLVFGFVMSPMLHTLTQSISTDTIFLMTFFVMCIHLITFDYGLQAFVVSKAISLNAAIFGAICLASRIPNSLDGFIFLVISMKIFVLLPFLLKRFWTIYWHVPIAIFCLGFLYNISLKSFAIYSLIEVFVNIFCPYIFIQNQKYKSSINGPWDEAVLKATDINSI